MTRRSAWKPEGVQDAAAVRRTLLHEGRVDRWQRCRINGSPGAQVLSGKGARSWQADPGAGDHRSPPIYPRGPTLDMPFIVNAARMLTYQRRLEHLKRYPKAALREWQQMARLLTYHDENRTATPCSRQSAQRFGQWRLPRPDSQTSFHLRPKNH